MSTRALQRRHFVLAAVVATGLAAAAATGLAAAGSMAAPAAESTVTLGVRPTVVRYAQKPAILGAVTSGRAGEAVMVQFRQCGLYPAQFRDFMSTTTIAGGAWTLDELLYVGLSIPASGTFRALWKGETSREVELKMRAFVDLRRLPFGRGFHVRVSGVQSFWHRRVRIERFDRRLSKWILVRSLLLEEPDGSRYYGGSSQTSETAPFRPKVAKGTTLRAVLPLAAARPCYLAGYSTLQRT